MPNNLGRVFAPDCGYQIFPNRPKRVRFADASFIASGRLPGDKVPLGHVQIPPDLAVEVISPRDSAYKVEEKIEDYLEAGIRLIWVVYPNTRRILIYRQNGSLSRLGTDDELTGDDVIPGFHCRAAEVFANT
jgi:Uma2 family endonuclease